MDYTIATNSTAVGAGDTAPAGGTLGEFTEGNPATATPATVLPAYQMNAIVQEIRNAISGAGLTPDRTDNSQLLAAISAVASGAKSFLGSGYQKLPSGLIIQWFTGSFTVAGAWSTTFTLPITFPNAGLQAVASDVGVGAYPYGVAMTSPSQVTVSKPAYYGTGSSSNALTANNASFRCIALGY